MRLAVSAVAAAFLLSTVAFAQTNWDKNYPVSGRPNLQVEVDDVGVTVRNCNGCQSVHIHVDPHGQDLSRWRITEMQGGNGIRFGMRRLQDHSFWGMGWHGQSPEVVVETPVETDLSVHSSNGAVGAFGLRGAIELKTSNGALSAEQTAGPLRLFTSNGSVAVRRAEGTLTANTSNGAMNLQGRFSQVEAQTSEGALSVQLLPGSTLQSSSRVSTSNGPVTVTVPRDLRADVQASTSNGHISDGLNLQNSSHDENNLHGLMNGGGPTLRVGTSNGPITLNAR